MLWVVLASLGLGACTRSPEANAKPEPAPSAATAASTTATSLFCAYGGVGVVPDPLPPGYETVFGVHAFELENSGPAAADGITVLGASLLDDAGNTVASLRRVDHFVTLPQLPSPGPTLGIFAVYLNPEGSPFSGTLPPGSTKLRVRFSLDRSPAGVPARCRLELGRVGAAPLVIEGAVDGSWPT